jgi:hypothetical protein
MHQCPNCMVHLGYFCSLAMCHKTRLAGILLGETHSQPLYCHQYIHNRPCLPCDKDLVSLVKNKYLDLRHEIVGFKYSLCSLGISPTATPHAVQRSMMIWLYYFPDILLMNEVVLYMLGKPIYSGLSGAMWFSTCSSRIYFDGLEKNYKGVHFLIISRRLFIRTQLTNNLALFYREPRRICA